MKMKKLRKKLRLKEVKITLKVTQPPINSRNASCLTSSSEIVS